MKTKYEHLTSFIKLFKQLCNRIYKNHDELADKYKKYINHNNIKYFMPNIHDYSILRIINTKICDIKIIDDILILIDDIHDELEMYNDFESDFFSYMGVRFKEYFINSYKNDDVNFFIELFTVINFGLYWSETDNAELYEDVDLNFIKKLNEMWIGVI